MTEVSGKRVLVVGLARSGRAAARCLNRHGALVTVTDIQPPAAFRDVIPELVAGKIGLELGVQGEETFLRQDLIVISPGVPWDLPQLRAAREKRIPVVPEVEVASWFLPGRLVGITGTNGKTTTTALLGKILQASGFATFVGGNIGVPLISAVDNVSPDAVIVAELSSFQLEGIQNLRPHVAVLLNITPNHLDRHASFEAYLGAKAQILSNLTAEDYAVLNADDTNVMSLVPTTPQCRKIFFSRRQNLPQGVLVSNGHVGYRVGHLERALLEIRDVRLPGAFNLENVLAASAAACVLGADFEAVRTAAREFKGVEHRLEFVRQIRGVDFYNDSKATSVDAAAKALSAFERGVHLILGGKDKGAPYSPLRPLLEGRVRTVFLIGGAAERIAQELAGAAELVRAGDLETAVRQSSRQAQPGDVVLLSPACASFDQFQDFEHRGRVFKQIVENLAREVWAKATESHKAVVGADSSSRRFRPGAKSARDLAAESPGSRPLEPVSAYEVGAEEAAHAGGVGVRTESAADEISDAPFGPPEVVEDEPLLFEVRTAPPGGPAEKTSSSRSKASGAAAGESKRESPPGSPSSQGRLPGI